MRQRFEHFQRHTAASRRPFVEPQACTVIADGERSDDWREMDGDIEISTAVGEHTFLFRMN